MIHLLILLVHLARGSAKPKQCKVRKRPGEAVVIFCLSCQRTSLATEVSVERWDSEYIADGWQRDALLYTCNTCNAEFNAYDFQNDGTGVLHARSSL